MKEARVEMLLTSGKYLEWRNIRKYQKHYRGVCECKCGDGTWRYSSNQL